MRDSIAETNRLLDDVAAAPGWDWPEPLDLRQLAARDPEAPRFIVDDWLPCGYATLLAGHGGVGNVSLDEFVPRVVEHPLQVLEPPGIGQLVERGDVPVGMCVERMPHEIRADEPGSACHKHISHRCRTR